MNYSMQEVMQYVEEEDVKFIRLAFCDVFGRQKNISIMPEPFMRPVGHHKYISGNIFMRCTIQLITNSKPGCLF